MHTIIAGTATMMADHLHGLSLSLRDDCDFGPWVLSRCVLEAAGKVVWILDPDLDVRGRVARNVAVRIRGLMDTHRQAEDLCEAYRPEGEPPPPDDDANVPPAWREYFDLVDTASEYERLVTEGLKNAHELRVPVHSNRETREVVGLKEAVPSGAVLAYGVLKRLKVPALSGYYGVWSGALHSTYDAIRGNLITTHGPSGYARLGTSLNDRLRAACLAMIGSIGAVDALTSYFGFDEHPVRSDRQGPLGAMQALLFRTFDVPAYVDVPIALDPQQHR